MRIHLLIRLLPACVLAAAVTACIQPLALPPGPTPASQPIELPALAGGQPTAVFAAPSPTPTPTPTPQPVTVNLAASLPPDERARLAAALDAARLDGNAVLEAPEEEAANRIVLAPLTSVTGEVLAERFFAVVAPFATVGDDLSWPELRARWSGESDQPLLAADSAAPYLASLLGATPSDVIPAGELLQALRGQSGALGILPLDELDPAYKVLRLDGVNVLSNQLDVAAYPLAAAIAITGPEAPALAALLSPALQPSNRDPSRLTTLVMTGVTAMSRQTAQRMERRGYDYPALVIGPELRAADITHVSNEAPFIAGCKVNASANNLRFCSDTSYWTALEAIGVDIVGLSGNHVNDFGRSGARQSLAFYAEMGAPVYGSGLNEEAACAPLLLEHNGNTFAFIAALAWWPQSAWATKDQPGACYYYRNQDKILSMVRTLSQEVDVVAVELQHYERYDPRPTPKQVQEFRQLRQAGAAIVTGVQSHVPQAMEPYSADAPEGPGMIVYGLGNLFFDQMWSWQTRTGLIARHTVYDGRLINTEIMTTVLENYAQPRWATPKERGDLLRRIFAAAPKRAD